MQEASQHTIVNFNQTTLQNRSYSISHNFFFQIAFKQKAFLFFNLETVEKKILQFLPNRRKACIFQQNHSARKLNYSQQNLLPLICL